MTQSFIQPKGSLNTQVDVAPLQQQLAQMFANQQVQNQAEQQAEATDPMRQTVQDYLSNKILQEVEIPQFTTIQDIFNAPKGEKLNTFGSFLNTPSGQNLIGGVLGLLSGGALMGIPDDSYSTYLRNDMRNRQANALAQQKEQNDIATALNNAYKKMDIANEQNKLRRELAEQEMQFKREQMEEARREKALDRAQKMQMLNMRLNSLGGSSGGGAKNNDQVMSGLSVIDAQLKNLQDSFENANNPYRYRIAGGVSQKFNTLTPAESNFNSQISLLFNPIARTLGGEKGVLSDQDIARIREGMPTLADTNQQKHAKMKAIFDLVELRCAEHGIHYDNPYSSDKFNVKTGKFITNDTDRKSQYRTGGSSDNDPMGLGL